MTDHTPSMIDRFRQLPRAAQWAALGVMALVLFLAWDEYLHPIALEWDEQASRIESQVNDVKAAARDTQRLQQARHSNLVKSIGPVRVPVSMADGSKMLNDLVIEVLEKHRATNIMPSQRSRGPLPKSALMTVLPGKRLGRLAADLKFDATPENAIAIIADLESSEHVESINSVRILRDTGGKVKVHLTLESWLVVTDGPTGATL